MKDLAILYLGAFAPDTPEHTNAATSRAAVLFQQGLLDAMVASELPSPEVRCYYPVPSYPRGRLLCLPRTEELASGLRVRSLAHLNLGFFKIATLGVTSAWAALCWGLRNRGKRRVVVSYNLNAPPAYLVGPVCRLLGMKFVPFVGDVYVPGEVVADSWLRRAEFAAQRRCLPRADGLIVCNRAIVDDFAPGRGHVLVEGGVDEEFVERFEVLAEKGREFRIVFAGQLSRLNGVELLVRAMRHVQRDDVRVTVMGGGPLESLVREAAADDARIEFLGLVPHETVMERYAAADLLVNLRSTQNSTHRYVFPSKVVECLATGVPLLSTRTGHMESEFGEFVFLLDKETPEALAAKIEEIAVMRSEDRESLGRSAQRHVLRHKTWSAHMAKIRDYIEFEVFSQREAA